jgi:hypothetical protein
MHTAHTFVLTVAAPVECALCRASCYGRYQCVPCKINLHPKCLLGTVPTPVAVPTPVYVPNDVDALDKIVRRVTLLNLI